MVDSVIAAVSGNPHAERGGREGSSSKAATEHFLITVLSAHNWGRTKSQRQLM